MKTRIDYADLMRSCLDHPYDPDVCFVCATGLTSANRTEEHAIPKWLQQEYDLWNQKLILLNRTEILYRQLTIPCCAACNGRLSRLENTVKTAVQQGPEGVRSLPRFLIHQWLAKLFLGIMYKELFLALDRKQPAEAKIMDPVYLKQFAILHFWLQVSFTHGRSEFVPGSVFIFRAKTMRDKKQEFDLLDNPPCRTIAVRIGTVGIMADFLENGLHYDSMKDILSKYEDKPLDPIQFREMACKVFYKASLLDLEIHVQFLPAGDKLRCFIEYESKVDGDYLFRDWSPEEYARFLSFYLQKPIEEVYQPPDKVMTWMPWMP